MWNNVKRTIVTALATLGVLFIIIMVWPEDKEETPSVTTSGQNNTSTSTSTVSASVETPASVSHEPETPAETEEPSETGEPAAPAVPSEPSNGNEAAGVNIPSSESRGNALSFKTISLDEQTVSQDIFADYDLTIVHVWGTFCGPCIAEMGDYADLYKELPSNVNLIGIICDVYDGIDSNVSDARKILGDAGAEFMNLRTSDDVYDITSVFQYVPSSFFVDREGHVIGKMMDGASFSETKSRLDGYLQ
ncbi:MAG: TlpA family protein disulfide reductase [Lachnospiraceae bacterium]|nr:TlpA family protein disulfide reductase [Lachnospiraceae bacterium]